MSNLVGFVTVMQLFPNRMQIRGKKLHEALLETYGDLIRKIEVELISGEDVDDCLVKSMLEVRGDQDLDDLDMAIFASAFMIHGVETVRPADGFIKTKVENSTFLDGGHHAVLLGPDPGTPGYPKESPRRTRPSSWP